MSRSIPCGWIRACHGRRHSEKKVIVSVFFFVLSTFRDHSSGVENVVVAVPALAWSAEPLVALY